MKRGKRSTAVEKLAKLTGAKWVETKDDLHETERFRLEDRISKLTHKVDDLERERDTLRNQLESAQGDFRRQLDHIFAIGIEAATAIRKAYTL